MLHGKSYWEIELDRERPHLPHTHAGRGKLCMDLAWLLMKGGCCYPGKLHQHRAAGLHYASCSTEMANVA